MAGELLASDICGWRVMTVAGDLFVSLASDVCRLVACERYVLFASDVCR